MANSRSLLVQLSRAAQRAGKSRSKTTRRKLKVESLETRRYLAGDLWTQRGGDAGHDNYVDTSIDVSQLNHLWTASNPTNQSSWSFDLAIDQQRVYRTELVGYSNSFSNFRVVARDINSGTELWSTPISAYAHEGVSEPTYANGIVYVNASGHSGISGGTDAMVPKLYGLNASTGAIVLTKRYEAQWGSGERPVVSNGRLIVEDGYYGGISSYQASTLTRQWFVGRGAAYDPPYAAVDDSYAYAFRNEVYNLTTGARTFITHPTPGVTLYTPAVSGSGKVIFGSSLGLSAFDGDTHQHLWSTPLSAVSEFAVGNGLIAVTGGTSLRLIREIDGALLGTWQAPEGLTTTEVILTNTHVFVESTNTSVARIHALELGTLNEVWRFEHLLPTSYARMGMSLVDGRLALTHERFTKMFAVGAPNNAPSAINDALVTNEDTAGTIYVLANDSDLDGHVLSVASVSEPQHGAVTINANKSLTYLPESNFSGVDTFTYETSDGRGGTSVATVQVTVNAVNDRPLATGGSYSLAEDNVLSAQLSGSDPDGSAVTYRIAGSARNGLVELNSSTGAFSYTPNANFNGTDSFWFVTNDGTMDSVPATISLTIDAVNDAPVSIPMIIEMDEDGVAEGQLVATDADNALLSYLAASPSVGGSLSIAADGRFTYRPPTNFNGQTSFTFQAFDGELTSSHATVNVLIRPLNDAPVVSEMTYTISENLANGNRFGTVTAGDVDSSSLTFAISGIDATPFTINAQTGDLTVANSVLLDYERQTDFVFEASVTDEQGAVGRNLIRVRLTNVFEMSIDVLPGDPSNTINLVNKETQVALLGSLEFNPATIDLASVRLRGPSSSTGASIVKTGKNGYKTSFADVNGDGILDLIMTFSTGSTGLRVGDTSVRLTGMRSTATGPVAFDLSQTVNVINRRK